MSLRWKPAIGPFSLAFVVPLASVACDDTGAPERSSIDSAPGGPSPSGKSDDDATDENSGAFSTLALSSCVPAGYALPVSIGGSEPFDVTIDTGSTSMGVASHACSGCDVQPKFTPQKSTTDLGARAKSQYVTGGWSGEIYQDEISLADAVKASVKFVGIDEQKDFFVDQACGSKSGTIQGIIGLGPSSGALRGTTGFLDRFVEETKAPDVFATKLCDDGGTLWLGGYDASHTKARMQYTPIIDGALHAYAVRLSTVEVDGTAVPVATSPYPGTVVDTGSSAFLLAASAFGPVTKAIAANAKFKELVGEDASWFDNPDGQSCKKIVATKAELDAALPPLTLTFGKDEDAFTVSATATESYLAPYSGYWCSTLVSFDPSDGLSIAGVIGAPLMRSNVVVFDRKNQRIGFAPHTPCK